MIKIGDFSKLANVTIKTLHHYGELGLLKPAWIDRFTGYRYYTLEQLRRLNRILALKDLGLSLDQIERVLNENVSPAELRGMLHMKQLELEQRLEEEQARLNRIQLHMRNLDQEDFPSKMDILLKTTEAYPALQAHRIAPSRAEMIRIRKALMKCIQSCVEANQLKVNGSWLSTVEESEYAESNLKIVMTLPIASRPAQKVYLLDGQAIEVIETSAGQPIASTIHTGTNPEELTATYAAMFTWAQNNGYQISGPFHEVYHTDPPGSIEPIEVIEVQCPVQKLNFPGLAFASQTQKENLMEPKFVVKPAFNLIGMQYIGKNENNEVAEMWSRFVWRINEPPRSDPMVSYGLCDSSIPNLPEGEFEYVAGVEVNNTDRIPEGMVLRQVPERKYAVFAHRGLLDTLPETYQYIYQVWLPKSGLQVADLVDMEVYDKDFIPGSPNSVMYIYIPVK